MRLAGWGKDFCIAHVASSEVMATRVRNVWGTVTMCPPPPPPRCAGIACDRGATMPIAGVRHADAGHWQLVRDHGGGSLVVASSNASPCRQRLSVHMWTLPRTGRMATAKSSVKEKFAKKHQIMEKRPTSRDVAVGRAGEAHQLRRSAGGTAVTTRPCAGRDREGCQCPCQCGSRTSTTARLTPVAEVYRLRRIPTSMV
ncbi:hypothetical protein COCCADRAFT_28125 [Bipolaris zeicola 26-R-13]|uniref:Uncharacterized protein n=1 Tax=Cochliobolus carbonum (strain 26-R-13) TaxID=930089 RepID=W6YIB8_COCC2|nr:uncharacterized protein COCCADRAFT_28125 [Bipolaris zeicola 26-R-13]EUC31081.1 hypothetical protein COCCADRAFT_28125 [Bipolaris zeicola 26-R-13]